ncbi:MAG: hypothetical protein DRJ61_12400 [Acidobacteria bacterium]|nr:MAG: hypothetical protein DRJ61_12400 [Acidobacteriota bacterium]
MDIASRRILRMAVGTSLAMSFSQMAGGSMSFISAVFAFVFLSLPLPRPTLKFALGFVLILTVSFFGGALIVPFLEHYRWAGILMFVVALFHSFYFPAKGGSPVLGTLATVGLTMAAAIGTVSPEALLGIATTMSSNAAVAMLFVWLAHALMPDPPADPAMTGKRAPKPPVPDMHRARLRAMRSMMIVLPLALFLLFNSSSTSYAIIMIKVATMGQQANVDSSRTMGRSLIVSTIIGGIGAIIAWQVLSIWPSLVIYILLIALSILVAGPKIFEGAAMHPNAGTWSYGILTMIIVLAPAVMDGAGSDGASSAFYTRLLLFLVIAVYGSGAVAVFDAFWPKVMGSGTQLKEQQTAA